MTFAYCTILYGIDGGDLNEINDHSYKNNVIGIVFIFQLIFISNENIFMVLVLVNDNPITVCALFFLNNFYFIHVHIMRMKIYRIE